MTSRPLSDRIRSNVWGLVACFIAITGTAVVADADQGAPNATKAAGSSKQVKKLRAQVAGLSAELGKLQVRLAALEGKPAPVIPATPEIPTTLPPSGPAGGELAGSYPSPTIGTVFGLSLASGTTPATGIAFGTDVNLYRQSANLLVTDDAFGAGNISGDTFVALGDFVTDFGYLDPQSGMDTPPAGDCNSTNEIGRIRYKRDVNQLWVCDDSGWLQILAS